MRSLKLFFVCLVGVTASYLSEVFEKLDDRMWHIANRIEAGE